MSAAVSIPRVPSLPGDKGHSLDADSLIERQLAWELLHQMRKQFPQEQIRIDTGDDLEPADSFEDAMELVFSTGLAHIHFGKAWVLVICGNGVDFISDYVLRAGVEDAVRAAEIHVGTRQEDE